MKESRPTAFILGASRGVGRRLAEALASKGYDLFLLARGERDLATLGRSLKTQYPIGNFYWKTCDLGQVDLEPLLYLKEAHKKLGHIHRIFLVAGANSDGDEIPMDPATIDQMSRINGQGMIHFMNGAAQLESTLKLQSLCYISTIATTAPRKRNGAYASAKMAGESFANSLRHYFAGRGILVQIYRLGYVATSLSFGQKLLFPVASPEAVASYIVTHRKKDFGTRYFPRYWLLVTTVLRFLPWFIFKRLKF